MYKTLPSALRGSGPRGPDTRSHAEPQSQQQPIFGGLNLGLANLISGGMNLLGHLRRKTPSSSTATTPVAAPKSFRSAQSSATASRSSSVGSADVFYESCEHIELCSFPMLPDPAGEGQSGIGHRFAPVGSFNPTWCDLCGDLIWGLYDTGAVNCLNCNYTCHVKCQRRVRLNCSILLDSDKKHPEKSDDNPDESTLANISTLQSEELEFEDALGTLRDVDHITIDHDEDPTLTSDVTEDPSFVTCDETQSVSIFGSNLPAIVAAYNRVSPPGQETFIENDDSGCNGFIRVRMNLRRPINVISGTRPPSIYNIMKDDTITDQTLTSFYLPHETEKALHVTTDTTTKEVIRSLLDKFRVADTPHKYALYEKTLQTSEPDPEDESDRKEGARRMSNTLSRLRMRKLRDDERPLVLALSWCRDQVDSEKCLLLQENDPGEISWESFSIPELKNFLLILDREEAWYKKRIHDKYEAVRVQMQALVNEKRPSVVLRESSENEDDSSLI